MIMIESSILGRPVPVDPLMKLNPDIRGRLAAGRNQSAIPMATTTSYYCSVRRA